MRGCCCLEVQDNSKVGIRATISRLSGLLQDADPELWYHLVHKNKARHAPSGILCELSCASA